MRAYCKGLCNLCCSCSIEIYLSCSMFILSVSIRFNTTQLYDSVDYENGDHDDAFFSVQSNSYIYVNENSNFPV